MAPISLPLMLLPAFAISRRENYHPQTSHIGKFINGERPWVIA
jgi:hypothetical protein